jgi:hypothetical protein
MWLSSFTENLFLFVPNKQGAYLDIVADQVYQMLRVPGNTGDLPDFVPKPMA